MRYVSVFSGIEAASVAWGPLGWEPVCFCEVDPFPSAVLRRRFPHVPNLGDIRGVEWREVLREWGPADVVVGGSPCQSFSIAGSRTGLEGESGLMWEYVRCVREVMPRWLLWENVPGALSSSHGEDFRCLLRALDELGYGLAWRVLDAQFFGVAQRRERLFVVGRLGDPGGACEVLFEPESLSWDTQTSREKRAELAARAGIGAPEAGGALNPADPQSKRVFSPEGTAPTLTAGYHEPAVLCMADTTSHAAVMDGLCGALKAHNASEPPVVAISANQRGEVRAQGGDGQVSGALQASPSGKQLSAVMVGADGSGAVVRRLTPVECERLQGFPDGWTRVPYRGRPAEECPDTPRYRAIGNSMAVPFMRWIGKRIQDADE